MATGAGKERHGANSPGRAGFYVRLRLNWRSVSGVPAYHVITLRLWLRLKAQVLLTKLNAAPLCGVGRQWSVVLTKVT